MSAFRMDLAPIVLFVYNRPWHTQQTVEALLKNDLVSECELFIFADGPKSTASDELLRNIQLVREYIQTISGFKQVVIEESEINRGLANSIIYGVTKVINQYGRVIVLEDDLITHPQFLRFMNDGLDAYEKDMRIYNIGGTNYNIKPPSKYRESVYMVHRSESCGWGTWKDRWDGIDWEITDYEEFCRNKRRIRQFNRGGDDMMDILHLQMDGKIDSWAIRWDYHMYKHNAYCIRPWKSCVANIGFDGTGVHSGEMDTTAYNSNFVTAKEYLYEFPSDILPDKTVERIFKNYWSVSIDHSFSIRKSVYKPVKRALKKMLKKAHIYNKC